jgi:acyl carrier protein
MSVESKRENIRNFIKKNLAKKPEHLEIGDQENIIGNGMVDSLGLIKIVNYLEESFSIRLKDEDITPDNFESIESISLLLEQTLNSRVARS